MQAIEEPVDASREVCLDDLEAEYLTAIEIPLIWERVDQDAGSIPSPGELAPPLERVDQEPPAMRSPSPGSAEPWVLNAARRSIREWVRENPE